jgi:hypothetical protein
MRATATAKIEDIDDGPSRANDDRCRPIARYWGVESRCQPIARAPGAEVSRGVMENEDIKIVTFNIRNGRAGNLEVALRAIEKMEIDIDVLCEMELTDDKYTKLSHSYEVVATNAKSSAQG